MDDVMPDVISRYFEADARRDDEAIVALFAEDGMVKVQGEIWQAHSDVPLQRGDRVKVVHVDGLHLQVTKTQ